MGERSSSSDGNVDLPKQVGGYEILAVAGKGAMGVVYKARQVSMDRIVALKILPAKLARDETYVARFLREARSAGACNHPNLLRVIEVGKADGLYFYSMEFVGGPTLKSVVMNHGPLSEELAVDYMAKLAGALAEVHRNGILHRDIKPDNILLTERGEVRLADLGLAKPMEGDASLTMGGTIIGTPHYMSPEQAGGTDLDGRADLYALGATFHYLLTGGSLFDGGSAAEVMAKHATEPPPRLRTVKPGASAGLEAVFLKLLQKEPDDRYADANQLASDLELVAAGKPPRFAKQAAAARVKRRTGHHRRATRTDMAAVSASRGKSVAAVVIGLSVLAAGTVLTLAGGSDAPEEASPPPSHLAGMRAPVVGPGQVVVPVPANPEEAALGAAERFASENPERFGQAIERFQKIYDEKPESAVGRKAEQRIVVLEAARDEKHHAAFKELVAAATELVEKDDFDGALSLLDRVGEPLATQKKVDIYGESGVIRAQALAKIRTGLASAGSLLQSGDVRGARRALKAVNSVKYVIGLGRETPRIAALDAQISEKEKNLAAAAAGAAMFPRKTPGWPAPENYAVDFDAGLPQDWKEGKHVDVQGGTGAVAAVTQKSEYVIRSDQLYKRGHFVVHPDTVLNVRARVTRPGYVSVVIRTMTAQEDGVKRLSLFGGLGWGTANQFRTYRVPVSKTKRGDGNPHTLENMEGLVCWAYALSSRDEDRGLVVDRVWVSRDANMVPKPATPPPAVADVPAPAGAAPKAAAPGAMKELATFDALLQKGDYAGARASVAGGTDPRLRAAAKMAGLLVDRSATVRASFKGEIGNTITIWTAKGQRKGEVESVDDAGVRIATKSVINRVVMGVSRATVAWKDLTEVERQRRSKGWRPGFAEREIIRAAFAVFARDVEAAKEALAGAATHPLAPHYRALLDAVESSARDDEARDAWGKLKKRVAAKRLDAASERALLKDLDAFEAAHGKTAFAKGVAADIANARGKARSFKAPLQGLMGYWSFDEGRGAAAADGTVRKMRAELVGGATWARGASGGGVNIAAGQHVLVRGADAYDIGGADFTVSAWIRPRGDGAVLAKTPPDGPCLARTKLFTLRERRLAFHYTAEHVDHSATVSAGPRLDDGSWHHVAFTYSVANNLVKLYVDGLHEGSAHIPLTPDPAGHVLRAGFVPGAPHDPQFTGSLDELRIYARELREAEVARLHTADGRALAAREALRKSVNVTYQAEKSMRPYPVGFRSNRFPSMIEADPTASFYDGPVYFDQRTGHDAYYEVRTARPVTKLRVRMAGMRNFTLGVIGLNGQTLGRIGPHGGGNKWAEFEVTFPASTHFVVRIHNEIGHWVLIDRIFLE